MRHEIFAISFNSINSTLRFWLNMFLCCFCLAFAFCFTFSRNSIDPLFLVRLFHSHPFPGSRCSESACSSFHCRASLLLLLLLLFKWSMYRGRGIWKGSGNKRINLQIEYICETLGCGLRLEVICFQNKNAKLINESE